MNALSKANRLAHTGRPATPEGQFLTLWQPSRGFIHCCIESEGCRYSKDVGACIMCDYGVGRRVEPWELTKALQETLRPHAGEPRTLLLGSYGSIFDPKEIPEDSFRALLDFLKDYPVPQIIFETHCSTVTVEKLSQIQKALPDRHIIIEMGYESCDPYVLHTCLNKVLDLSQLERTIELVHSFGMSVCLNVFVGAPFLTAADQLASARESVLWALRAGADSLVVFPANIKPFTLLDTLYRSGDYQPLSHWMLPALFRILPDDALARITLSWYGERKNFYKDDAYPLIPPRCCEVCHGALFDFYRAFLQATSGTQRKALTDQIWAHPLTCSCREELRDALEVERPRLSVEEIERIVSRSGKMSEA